MKLLKEYEEKRKELLNYFGYENDWEKSKIEDETDSYWHLIEDGVRWSPSKTALEEDDGFNYYESIFSSMIVPIYHGKDYIMFSTHDNGETYLMIFDNTKQIEYKEDEE